MKQLLALLLLTAVLAAAGDDVPSAEHCQRFKARCRQTLESRLSMPPERLQYAIAWGVSYDLDAMLEGYLATGDREFLDLFVPLAKRAVSARADKLGQTDWRGRLRPGWLADESYGTGGPVTLLDAAGNPSLEIVSTLLSNNQLTDLFVLAGDTPEKFTLEVRNPRAAPRLRVKRYEHLTMERVETAINSAPGRSVVRVKRVGTLPPSPTGPVRTPGNRFVMHGHHTGKAVIPLLRFALIVRDNPALAADYGAPARDFLQCAEEAMRDMDGDWREHPDGGYIVFERGMPFWCDGVAEPNNTLALSGLAYLYLGEATGRAADIERARKLASFMRRELIDQPDGTVNFYYWSRINRHGWTSGESVHTPNYPIAVPSVEDTSHFQHSLRFFVECHRRKLVITDADLQKLARTFHTRIDRGDQEKPLAERLDGSILSGANYQHFQAGWAEFREFDPSIPERLQEIFLRRHQADRRSSALFTIGVLLRAQSQP